MILRALRFFSLDVLLGVGGVLLSTAWAQAETLVRTADGSPAAFAQITVWSCGPAPAIRLLEGPLWQGKADAQGRLSEELATDCLMVIVDSPAAPPQVLRLEEDAHGKLTLQAGATVRGHVVAASPINSGELCVLGELNLESIQRSHPWKRCAMVSTDGTFTVLGVPRGSLRYELKIPGYLVLSGVDSAQAAWTLRPKLGAPFFGHVVDPSGTAVVGAEVTSPGAVRTASDAHGAFRIAIAGPPAEVDVSATGFVALRHQVAKLPAEPGPRLRLERGMWLELTVAGDPSEPVPRATVTVERRRSQNGWDGEDFGVEGEDGLVQIPVQRPGTYRVRVRAPGYRAAWVDPFEVQPATTVRLGTIALDRGLVVRGRFVTDEQRPVRGVRVRLEPQGAALLADLEVGYRSSVSGRDGRFEFSGLTSGRYDLRARHSRAGQLERSVDLSGDGIADLGDLALEAPAVVHGRVVNRRGVPRGDVQVKLFDEAGARLLPLDSWNTDERGRFEARIPVGRYTFRVESDHVLLSQAAEVSKVESDLELTVPGVAIHGVVVRGGEPVQDGTVALVEPVDPGLRSGLIDLRGSGEQRLLGGPTSRQSAPVDVAGRFDFADVAPGLERFTYLAVDGRRWTRDELIADQSDASVEIDLTGVDLRGLVHERDSEIPVASAELHLVADLGDSVAEATTGADGQFSIPDLQPASYTLAVKAPGFAAKTLTGVHVEPGMRPIDCALDRGEAGDLHLHLTRPDGSPAAFDFMTIVDVAGQKIRAAPTDATGRVDFESLPAGTYFAIWADPLAGVGVSRPVVLAGDGGASQLDQTLPEGVDVLVACAACASKPAGSMFLTSGGLLLNGGLPQLAGGRVFPLDGVLPLGRVSMGARYRLIWNDGTHSIQRDFVADRDRVILPLP